MNLNRSAAHFTLSRYMRPRDIDSIRIGVTLERAELHTSRLLRQSFILSGGDLLINTDYGTNFVSG